MPRERRAIPWLKVRDGTYYVYWYDAPTNRTKRISLATQESTEAQSRYAGFLQRGHEIFGPGRGDRRLGVTVALDQYLTEHVAKNVVDRKRAEGIVRLLKQWFKNSPFEEVDIPACQAYVKARVEGELLAPLRADGAGKGGKPVSESTARRELGILNAAAEHAARWKRMGLTAKPPTPMPSIELPPSGEARVVFLTKPELAVAIDSATGRLQDFMKVLYSTAGRRRSVERLKLKQIDLRAGTINLTGPDETPNEKRSKKNRPIVPLDAQIRPTVERWMIESKKVGSEWLWGAPDDMYTAFNDHMVKIGFPDKAFPHVMRHSRASHLLMDGVPIYHVAKLLGDTVATVERVYSHALSKDLGDKIAEYGT